MSKYFEKLRKLINWSTNRNVKNDLIGAINTFEAVGADFTIYNIYFHGEHVGTIVPTLHTLSPLQESNYAEQVRDIVAGSSALYTEVKMTFDSFTWDDMSRPLSRVGEWCNIQSACVERALLALSASVRPMPEEEDLFCDLQYTSRALEHNFVMPQALSMSMLYAQTCATANADPILTAEDMRANDIASERILLNKLSIGILLNSCITCIELATSATFRARFLLGELQVLPLSNKAAIQLVTGGRDTEMASNIASACEVTYNDFVTGTKGVPLFAFGALHAPGVIKQLTAKEGFKVKKSPKQIDWQKISQATEEPEGFAPARIERPVDELKKYIRMA